MAGDGEKYEVKFARERVCMRMTSAEEHGDDMVKEGRLEVVKGQSGHLLQWMPNDERDKDLGFSFLLSELYSFTRVVPKGGLSSFMVFNLKSGTRHLALEFHQGGTRELICSLQGVLEYKRSDTNQNEYIVCETSPEVVSRAMESLNLFEGVSLDRLETSLPRTPQSPTVTFHPMPNSHYGNGRDVHTSTLWKNAPHRAKEGVRFVGRMVRGLVTDARMNEEAVDAGVMRMREEDSVLAVVSREDSGFEVLSKKSSLPQIPRPQVTRTHPLTSTEWHAHLDPEGRVTCHHALLERIFRGGVEHDLRRVVWKYLLNYYQWNNTAVENSRLAETRKDEYYAMKYQWRSLLEPQLQRNSIVRDRKLQIDKDVRRTDRALEFFREEDGENMLMLNDILITYTFYNFDLGYVQGMNDLLSPILMLMPTEHDAFWCFAGLMDRMERNFEVDQAGMKQQLQQLSSLVQTIDEQLFDHLERAESNNMYFCFRWLLLHFKREFSVQDAMRMYEVLWTDRPCPNFHLLVAAAILDAERDRILVSRPDLTDILKHINDIALKIDLERCLRVAEAIYLQMRACKDLPDDIVDIFGLNNDAPSLVSSGSQP